MKSIKKFVSAVLLASGAISCVALINKGIQLAATYKKCLPQAGGIFFPWCLGKVFYTKEGNGNPLLLIHDLHFASNGCEWNSLIPFLKEHYTVYTIDLPGCGRSEKPNMTYTNFLYVELLSDFIRSEIGGRTRVIASGASSSLAVMAGLYRPDLFDEILLINPDSLKECSKVHGKHAKIYKRILDAPVIGTLLYHIAASKKKLKADWTERLLGNFWDPSEETLRQCHESAHLGEAPRALYSSVLCGYTKCNIAHALEKIENKLYILGGSEEPDIQSTIQEYTSCNPAIASSLISGSKHLPHIENPEDVFSAAELFFC